MALMVSLTVIMTALPARAAEDKSTLPASIYCVAYAADLRAVFLKRGGDEYQEVGLSAANIVEAGKARVENDRILLYGPAGEDGKHQAVAEVETAGIRQPLIVLHPSTEEGRLAYEAKALEGDPEKFPLGSFSLVNLSPHPVRISHDDLIIELESAGGRIFTPDHSAGDALAMKMEYKSGENWLLLSSARWASRNDRRTLVCFHLDPSSKRMIVKSVPLRGKLSH